MNSPTAHKKQHSFHPQNYRYDCPGPLNFTWPFLPVRGPPFNLHGGVQGFGDGSKFFFFTMIRQVYIFFFHLLGHQIICFTFSLIYFNYILKASTISYSFQRLAATNYLFYHLLALNYLFQKYPFPPLGD